MRKIGVIVGMLLIIGAAFVGPALAGGVAGVYKITYPTPMGEGESTLTIKADGTGTIASMFGEAEMKNLKIDGNKFQFDITEQIPPGPVDRKYKGSVDGNKIAGTFSSPMGDSEFKGTRK